MIFTGWHGRGFGGLMGAVLFLGGAQGMEAQTLYDAATGTLPEAQGWTYAAIGSATEQVTNNSVLLDTSLATNTQAGWSQVSGTDLDRSKGFTLLFKARLNAEIHASTNRAGFSVILLGDDKRGIELGFWTNTIFAQTDSPLFTHGEEAGFSTSATFVNYALTLLATNYALRANGAVILSGPVRDYTAFNGFPNPYRTPDLVFFGDDTSSASASVNVPGLTLVAPPLLSMPATGVVSWAGVSNQTYRVQASTNLTTWSDAGTATSSSNSFRYTNSAPQPAQYFRTAFP